MFKKIILIILIILELLSLKMVLFSEENIVLNNEPEEKSNDLLAIMVEGDSGYELWQDNAWPTDGYAFNSTLSKCENGGKLSWSDGKVTIKTNTSDKCYVYFDKKPSEPLKINKVDVDAKTTYNTVKLTVNATGGSRNYNYSVENTCTQCDKPQDKCGVGSTNPNVTLNNNIITISNLVSSVSSYRHTFVVKVSDGQTEQTYIVSDIEVTEYCNKDKACSSVVQCAK